MKRVLLIAPHTTPGVASLAQSLLDAHVMGWEAAWLCHPHWTLATTFWHETLGRLDRAARLPLRQGPQAGRLEPGWTLRPYRLVILGLSFGTPSEGNRIPLEALKRLHAAHRRDRPVVFVERHASSLGKRCPGPATILEVNHQRDCRLLCGHPGGSVSRVGAVASLAREEARGAEKWLRRARGLIARHTAAGKWELTMPQTLERLYRHDWSYFEHAPLPELAAPQQSMLVLERTLVLSLEGVAFGWRRHVLEEALQATGCVYAVGLWAGNHPRLMVCRRWKGPTRYPTVTLRLRSLLRRYAWGYPSDDCVSSLPLSADEQVTLLDEVLQHLEGSPLPQLPRLGGIRLLGAGELPITVGKTSLPADGWPSLELDTKGEGPSRLTRSGLRLRGAPLPTHPALLVVEGRVRTNSIGEQVRRVLESYRDGVTRGLHKEFLHDFRGRLSISEDLVSPDEVAKFLKRVGQVIEQNGLPWPADGLGSREAEEDMAAFQEMGRACRGEAAFSGAAALRILHLFGTRRSEVGSLRVNWRSLRGSLAAHLCLVEDPGGVRAVVWPSAHSEILHKLVQNAAQHALREGQSNWLLVVHRYRHHRPCLLVRDYGLGCRDRPSELLRLARDTGRGGLALIVEHVERYQGAGEIRTIEQGVSFLGSERPPLKRRWLVVGEPIRGTVPAWLELIDRPDFAAALATLENSPAGNYDGLILGPATAPADFSPLIQGRGDSWKWVHLPRVYMESRPLRRGEARLERHEVVEFLSECRGFEVMVSLPPLDALPAEAQLL